jgi:hypothetical protein
MSCDWSIRRNVARKSREVRKVRKSLEIFTPERLSARIRIPEAARDLNLISDIWNRVKALVDPHMLLVVVPKLFRLSRHGNFVNKYRAGMLKDFADRASHYFPKHASHNQSRSSRRRL